MKKQNKFGAYEKGVIITGVIVAIIFLILLTADGIKNMQKNNTPIALSEQQEQITNTPNAPALSAGMIPVKMMGDNLIICKNDSSWYNYSEGKLAYIMLNDGVYQSELVPDMAGKKLASDSLGQVVSKEEQGSIYMWIPRYAIDEDTEEIVYVEQEKMVAGKYNQQAIFTYETEKIDYSLAGIWVEKEPLTSASTVNTKVTNMNKENNTYGFIANVKGAKMTTDDRTTIEEYIAKSVGAGLALPNITNTNRTILKIIDTGKPEPIKAKAYYDSETGKNKIEVINSKNGIAKIEIKNGDILSTNSNTADSGNQLIGNKVYSYIIEDKLGNRKEVKVEVTGLDIYIIENKEDLKLFRTAVNSGKTTATTKAYQIADVEMNKGKYIINEETKEIEFAEDAEKLQSISGTFSGEYHGNNHTISGLYGNYGLFYYCNKAKIDGIGIINSYLKLGSSRGAIICYAQGNTILENCYSEATIEVMGDRVGGLVGETYNDSSAVQLTVNNCYNAGKIKREAGYSMVGGIGGYMHNANISNCYNVGDNIYTKDVSSSSGQQIGGVVGYLPNGSIKNCYNAGRITGTEDVGGVAGSVDSKIITANCYNTGNIEGYQRVGGIGGKLGVVNNSYNKGNISANNDYVGGIAGYLNMSYTTSTNLYNTGNIIGGGSYIGGICGALNLSNVTLRNCYNVAKVEGTGQYIGGICGIMERASISYSYNVGDVLGSQNVGGISGRIVGGQAGNTTFYSNINNSYNIGKISGTSNVGGIVGYANYYYRIGTNYSDCKLEGTSNVGGVAGFYDKSSSSSIYSNYYKTGIAKTGIGNSNSENGTIPTDEMPEMISKLGEGFIEDTNNINNGLPILSWQTDNDKLNLINGDNAFLEDTQGINNGYPILAWQAK